MSDLTKNLKSLSFESGLSEGESGLLHLRAHSAALTFCGCAHAVFLCQLLHSVRDAVQNHCANKSTLLPGELRVGIVGMGHLGKQLLLCILDKTKITASNIKVSTRRPECAGHETPGVECFFDNGRLGQWADVLFLCCLPSQLPRVCADLSPRLCTHTLVYSFSSAVPVSRLVQLLGHNFVLKSQHDVAACDNPDVWMTYTHLNTGLREPSLIKWSCPLSRSHSPSLCLKWVCAVLYSLVNICTCVHLEHKKTLYEINHLFKDKLSLDVKSVCPASSLSTDEAFPWISVIDAQTKETPLYSFLVNSKSTQECISSVYSALLEPSPHSN
ncbi:NADP-dependent oxidoreductase domain-containing protein 1 [Periophthalmus magnuspinnatus]|uniref:NADP-dependent oxidoreductase domain-containing protein 1 n=1 Tax=Periophthalmus magnuspinnatus TaxID=409849 RepID=UPI002436538A|nr:NADP-dependent oxidoreductase domain-containing protein 1 [Periophthalmus magnuspinnatus]